MKRLVLFLAMVLLFSFSVPVSSFAKESDKPAKSGGEDNGAQSDQIHNMISEMTLKEKIGQLFIVQVYGKKPRDPDYEQQNLDEHRGGKNFAEVINNYHIGGVIYYNWNDNIPTPLEAQRVQTLSNGVQKFAMDQRMSIPLMIGTDQEGGIVARVTSPATEFPGHMAVGATRSEKYAHESGKIMGSELNALGINFDFAPDLDVNVNPKNPVIGVRSFSENPDLVAKLGVAQINGFKSQDVLATAKHFPGHGDTDVDSHYGLPIINHDWETLWNVDLKPFRKAIADGIDAIMTAHIVVPELDDSGLPATLSKPIMTGLLRDQLGYDGLVITDALGMSGANVLPPEEVPVKAFEAGADILLNPPDVPLAYNAMLDAVNNGEISEDRVDQSVYRILKAKMEKGLFDDPYKDPDALQNIGKKAHLQMANEIANRSITLVQNKNHILPLKKTGKVLITGPSVAKPDQLSALLNDKGMETTSYSTSTSPTDAQIDQAASLAQNADTVIATTYTANTNAAQQRFVKRLQDTNKPIIDAAVRNPYDLMAFPEVDGSLVTYGSGDVSIKALAKAITGEINPFGRLPVTLPGVYDAGRGPDYVDSPLSADGMKTLVERLKGENEVGNEQTAHALKLHLSAVSHYESKGSADKVIKHMKGFKQLIKHEKREGSISDKANNYLDTEADRLIEKWSKDQ